MNSIVNNESSNTINTMIDNDEEMCKSPTNLRHVVTEVGVKQKDPNRLSSTALSLSSSASAASTPKHSQHVWLHAFYHLIVAHIGTGILGLPHATSFLGWTGTVFFITGISAYCYYTARLLIDLQDHTQSTYSAVADAIMGPGFSNYTVRPAQYVNFFLTTGTLNLFLYSKQLIFRLYMSPFYLVRSPHTIRLNLI